MGEVQYRIRRRVRSLVILVWTIVVLAEISVANIGAPIVTCIATNAVVSAVVLALVVVVLSTCQTLHMGRMFNLAA